MAWSMWRLLRGRGKQISLAACGVIALGSVVLGKAQASIFDDARVRLSDISSPLLVQIRAPLIAFENWASGLTGIFSLYRENMELRRENEELRKWQNVALSLENRMRRYETMLRAVPDGSVSQLTARVIGETNRPFTRTMILNAGAGQGVKKGEAVMDDRGLLGRVFVTGTRTSWVILLTDLNSRVPVMIEPTHRRAILTGDNSPSPQLELDVGDGPVKAGDRVLSTGDGGLLPPDLPIGSVTNEGGQLRVTLLARPESSDFVHVLDYGVPSSPPVASAADAPSLGLPSAPEPLASNPVAAYQPSPQPPKANVGASDPAAAENSEEDR